MQPLLLISICMLLQQPPSFKDEQIKNSRVREAYSEKEKSLKDRFAQQHLNYNGFHLFIRAFKKEQLLEVWVKEKDKQTYSLFTTYRFCSTSGSLGPKRKEGDYQIPEGVYHINHFNPLSNFHLSLGVSYPNSSDRVLSDHKSPGGAIYVHGNCVTIGCIPITDDKIKEVYVLAVEARNNGQQKIPIHIFPSKLDDAGLMSLKTSFASSPELIKFWENLKPVYQDFEERKKLKAVKINQKGEYYF
jgi:murein L,D-transpeptidase YafK